MTTERIKILKDAIKFIEDGKEKRTRVSYSQGGYTEKSGIPKETITIYARDYKHLPRGLNPENNSDSQTDYFENDTARITPKSKYYQAVLRAMKGKEESRERRSKKKESYVQETDHELMKKINKLAKASETNVLLDYEMSGYLKDKTRRDIFRSMAKHHLRPRKKYISVDQHNSAKYLIAVEGLEKGHVFGHKAYGQKGNHFGEIDRVLKDIEQGNESLMKAVMKRAEKNALNRSF